MTQQIVATFIETICASCDKKRVHAVSWLLRNLQTTNGMHTVVFNGRRVQKAR